MQRIGFIVFPDFEVLSLGTSTAFEVANMVAQEQLYELHVLSDSGGLVRTSIGMSVDTRAFDETTFDTLIVSGTLLYEEPFSPKLIAYVRNAPEKCRRVASICTGARVLAEAGLLDGRRATTHWLYGNNLQAHFPKVKVEDDRMFISDGSIWTSAGMTGCIDLALAMIEEDHGQNLARSVAQHLVVFHRRAGGQSQYSALLNLQSKSDRSRARWFMPGTTFIPRCPSSSSPTPRISVRASSAAVFAQRRASRRPRRSRSFASRRRDL
jgi:transcriptional regulator GlxA family with amidase domain